LETTLLTLAILKSARLFRGLFHEKVFSGFFRKKLALFFGLGTMTLIFDDFIEGEENVR
jgi:hypothetical protein